MSEYVREFFIKQGFDLEDTGGGCTWWIKKNPNNPKEAWTITDGDTVAPDELDDKVLLCTHLLIEGEWHWEGDSIEFNSMITFISWYEGGYK